VFDKMLKGFFGLLGAESLFLLLLAFPGTVKFCIADSFCCFFVVFEGFDLIVFVLFSTFEGNKPQLCGLEKQSSTNTDSHSISTFTS
jgi:hypothetical protein